MRQFCSICACGYWYSRENNDVSEVGVNTLLGKMKIKKSKQKTFRSPAKSKRGIQVKGTWTPVEMDPSLFSEEDMGGLVCFEELTDYSLVSSNAMEKVTKKRKADDGEDSENQVSEDDNRESQQTAKKKKKKNVKKKKQLAESTDDTTFDSNDGEQDSKVLNDTQEESLGEPVDSGEEDIVEPEKVTKKKKKRNKKLKKATTNPQVAQQPKTKKKVENWTNAGPFRSSGQDCDVSAWKDLFVPEPVLKALGSLGFNAPTPIQALALPPAIRDKMDILGAAETGSGKTLSFGIPMIHMILEWRKARDARSKEALDSQDNPTEETGEDGQVIPSGLKEPSDQPDVAVLTEEEDVQGEEDSEVDEDSQQTGCVKVIENVEFDFETTETTDKSAKTKDLFEKNPLLGLVLTPTRELAVQVKHHIDAVAKFTGIKTAIVVGGMALQKQGRVLNRRPEIVIATPGRLWELIRERHPHLSNLKRLRCLVIDEADRMVEKGHFAELSQLLEMLNDTEFNPKRQNFVFSATLTMIHEAPTRILQKKKGKKIDKESKLETLMEKVGIKSKPKIIDLTRKEATVESLTETRIHCDTDEKDFYLYYFLLQYPGRTMVFANSIDCIKRLNALLTILDCTPLPLHANMHQKQRLKNLERFAERETCVLLTTDVAARGLDIPDVQHVIHYQVPRTSETYVHRSGRTARATKEGLSLLLIGPDDVMNFRKIYRTLGKDEELPLFPIQTKCMAAIKERVKVARKIEKIEYHSGRAKQHNSWFQKAAEALEIDLDDDVLIGGGQDEYEDRQKQMMMKGMKMHLKHLLSQPVFKNTMKTKYPTQMGKLILPEQPAREETALITVTNQKKKEKKQHK
ncbi:ATP-dependent RNA helicase DDX24-like [Acipenser ruthenus]|uniref:ATP-dependent RNA helicase DDX24-like n=1 Tax=Acipenser ruthenus TaxID=7906 RepID=UPI00145A8209|nr:ATP-dependent RNA helicase DDX24-like [Acipenser ruthenus]